MCVAPSCPGRPDLQFQRGRRALEQTALVGLARSALICSTSSGWRNSAASCAVAVAVWRSGGLRLTVQVEQSIEFRVNNAQGAVNVVLEIGHEPGNGVPARAVIDLHPQELPLRF